MAARPRGRLVAPRLMSGAYGAILKEMERLGWAPPRIRAKLRKRTLVVLLLRRGLLGL